MAADADSPHVLILPPLLYLLGLAVGIILHVLAPRSIVPRSCAYVLAIVFLVSGIGLGSWARLHLKRRGTAVDPRRPTTALVTDGPYRYSRNPLYLRVTLLYLSFAFLVNDVWFVAVLPLVLIVLYLGVIRRRSDILKPSSETSIAPISRRCGDGSEFAAIRSGPQ